MRSIPRPERICPNCGKVFSRARPRVYCSIKCGRAAQIMPVRPVAERFWEKVDKSGGPDACWLWRARRNALGYGTLKVQERTILAHRIAYELHYGSIPDGALVCHHCDNPPCVNPAHLWTGTNRDNTEDRDAKERFKAKLSRPAALAIRRKYATGQYTQSQLAQEYGISEALIWRIVHNQVWRE